jgi:dinuclear metal center YbgI/SA1388 family protein
MGCRKSTPFLIDMGASVDQILTLVGKQAPAALAYSWDRIGLLIGSPRQKITKLVVALEATEAVLKGAQAVEAQMVLSHHPILFQSLERFCPDNPWERTIAYAIKHDLAVAAAHTNLDAAQDGLNAYLAELLGLTGTEPLEVTKVEPLIKLIVFVPVGYEDRVREAICQAGGGIIGNYSNCSFAIRGQGTYKPLPGAQPWRGIVSELVRAAESRLEVVVPEGLVAAALEELKTIHPYEEVAYDLYPLKNQGVALGIGRVGEWALPRPFNQVVADLKGLFRTSIIKMTGKVPDLVKRVAVCGGSGGELISQAREKGADIYITGDIRYHQAVPWAGEDMTILDLGHFATEVLFIPEWGRRLEADLHAASLPVEVVVDTWGMDPFSYV